MSRLAGNFYQFGDFVLDFQNRALRRGRESLSLTPKAFDVLAVLVQNHGQVVSKDELIRVVWPDSFVEESNLTQTVFMLRKVLGETAEQRYIFTVHGRGYRFTPEVKQGGNEHVKGMEAELHAGAPAAGARVPVFPFSIKESDRGWHRRPWLLPASLLGVVLIAVLAAYFQSTRTSSKTPVTRLMIAVLPLQNLTGDSTEDYFSDGLTEEMITRLGSINPQRFGVIARTSVMHYKNSSTPLDQIGRELGVQFVIEGSVRRDSKEVRITAQLIQAKDQTRVWAREYDRDLKDLLALQGEIAQEIADEIQLTFGNRQPVVARSSTIAAQNYEAYDLYLKGQYFLNQRTMAGLERAAAYFQQAIAKDPNYGRAYAGVADCYALMPGYAGRAQEEFIAKARAAAVKALEIDESLPEAHTALALIVQNYDWDWATAEKEFRRAIELNPNYATAHHWYAEHLTWRGRFDEALQESERARQLDPLSLIIASDNGAILYFSRQYDQAIEKWRSVLEMDPYFSRAHLIGAAYVERGMFAEALADNETMRSRIPPQYYWSTLTFICGRAHRTAQARHALQELLHANRLYHADPMVIAQAYAGLGDKDQSLAWLERAYAVHSNELVSLKVSPSYDALHGDARFRDLLRRVGLAN